MRRGLGVLASDIDPQFIFATGASLGGPLPLARLRNWIRLLIGVNQHAVMGTMWMPLSGERRCSAVILTLRRAEPDAALKTMARFHRYSRHRFARKRRPMGSMLHDTSAQQRGTLT